MRWTLIFAAVQRGCRARLIFRAFPPRSVTHIAEALIGDRPIEMRIVGIRPGEKVHEILVSEEEAHRTVDRGDYYAILPMLPGDCAARRPKPPCLTKEYSSADNVMSLEETDRGCFASQGLDAGRRVARSGRGTPLKIMTILGTRPEIIRLSLIVKLLDRHAEHILVDTGQNYDDRLSGLFFRELEVRQPDVSLGVRGFRFRRAGRPDSLARGGCARKNTGQIES